MTRHSLIRQKPNCSANICVVGCGHWGRNLIRNFHGLGHLAAICDANPASVQKFSAEFPNAKAYTDFARVLGDANIDAVVLATPAEMHYGMAMDALHAGKDV